MEIGSSSAAQARDSGNSQWHHANISTPDDSSRWVHSTPHVHSIWVRGPAAPINKVVRRDQLKGEFFSLYPFNYTDIQQLVYKAAKHKDTYWHQERRVAAITAAWGHFSQRRSEWPLTAAPINKLTPTLTDGSQFLSDCCCCLLEKQPRLIVYLSRRLSTTNARTKWQ